MEQRTGQQNRAMHLYFTMLSEALNDAGLDMQTVLKHYKIDVPWTPESVKAVIWKLVQEKMFGKEHTADLTTDEVNKVYEVVNRFTAKLGMESVPFPHIPDEQYSGETNEASGHSKQTKAED